LSLIPRPTLNIDGRYVEYEEGSLRWDDAIGGYGALEATLAEEDADTIQEASQGSLVKLYEAGEQVYEGRLVTNPHRTLTGTATIKCNGHIARADKHVAPFRLQKRDYANWADGQGDPHNYPQFESIAGENAFGSLVWTIRAGEAVNTADRYVFALWAEGSTIGRLALDWGTNVSATNLVLRITSAAGPSGAKTIITDGSLSGTTGSVNTGVIGSPQDQIMIEVVRTGSNTASHVRYRVRVGNLRVWGDRTTADTFTIQEALQNMAPDLGYDASGVSSNLSVDCLPLWHDKGSWGDVMAYLVMLQDGWFRVGMDALLEADTWANSRRWYARLSEGTDIDFPPLEKSNQVEVEFRTVAQQARRVTVTRAVPELDDKGLVNTYPIELPDPQPNDTLATSVAEAVADHVSTDRVEGSITYERLTDESGMVTRHGARPGDTIVLEDAPENVPREHRVTAISHDEDGATAAVGGDFPPTERILTLHDLVNSRRRVSVKVARTKRAGRKRKKRR
jgi:hypothetical protein